MANLRDYQRYSKMRVGTVYQGVKVTPELLRSWTDSRYHWKREVDRLNGLIREVEGRNA